MTYHLMSCLVVLASHSCFMSYSVMVSRASTLSLQPSFVISVLKASSFQHHLCIGRQDPSPSSQTLHGHSVGVQYIVSPFCCSPSASCSPLFTASSPPPSNHIRASDHPLFVERHVISNYMQQQPLCHTQPKLGHGDLLAHSGRWRRRVI